MSIRNSKKKKQYLGITLIRKVKKKKDVNAILFLK